jgi:hypothetical protein
MYRGEAVSEPVPLGGEFIDAPVAPAVNPDLAAFERLEQMSQPIPLDPSRGHELHLADTQVASGGVVVHRYMAFCHCHWSQRFWCDDETVARGLHAQHVSLYEPDPDGPEDENARWFEEQWANAQAWSTP